MFQRLREAREREGGFTLIELLVVVIIIAILAAIAIPVFLKQREKGWKSQAESAVKNAATAMETYAADNGGAYTGATLAKLQTAGFRNTSGVVMSEPQVTATTYCLEANHDSLSANVYFSSDTGKPSETSCIVTP